MPIRTGFVSTVHKHPRFPDRHDVWLIGPVPLYTLDPLKASLCQRAGTIHKAITARTRDTRWGEEILSVELAEEAA